MPVEKRSALPVEKRSASRQKLTWSPLRRLRTGAVPVLRFLLDGSPRSGWRGSGRQHGSPPPRVLQSVTFASRLHNVTSVSQPVERGPGQAFVVQDLCPLLEPQLRCHDQARSLVGRADHIETQIGSDLACRHVTHLVEDQKMQRRELIP